MTLRLRSSCAQQLAAQLPTSAHNNDSLLQNTSPEYSAAPCLGRCTADRSGHYHILYNSPAATRRRTNNINSGTPDQEALHACAVELSDERLPPGWIPVKSSAFTRVAYNASAQLYYKEFLPRSPAESLKALLRGSRATRARNNADALLQAGFAAPRNIAWGSLPSGRDYLFSSASPGQSVTHWLCDILTARQGADLQQRRTLLRALGTFIGRLHARGFTHGDLRPGNILACVQGERFHFELIDNESNSHKVPPPGKRLLKNLMQLNMLPPANLSRSDRMRFFCAWRAQMRELQPIESKILAAQAHQWAMRRLADKGLL